MSVSLSDYQSAVPCAWCPGCGNFGILEAVKRALVELDLPPHRVLICSGIGQAPKLPHYLKVNTFNGLHGREVAAAIGAKLAADDLTVLIHAGEGGAYGEGGNHFLHAIRRNVDMTLIVHDNRYYALTKGQASPTTDAGTVTKVNPDGVVSRPMNPLALAISQSCSFVAQGLSSRGDHLTALLKRAIEHSGFSFVNVLQPCVTWDTVHTYKFYKEHCYELEAGYDPTNRAQALARVLEGGDRLPLGVLYVEPRPTYDACVLRDIPQPLRHRELEPEHVAALFPRFQ